MAITYLETQALLNDLAAQVQMINETEWTTPLPDYYSKYAKVITGADPVRIYHTIVGLGMPSRTAELELPRNDSPQAGRKNYGVSTTYQLGVQYSLKAKRSPTGAMIIQRTSGMIRVGFKEYKELQMADIWLRSFTAPASGGVGAPDGLPLFSNAHTTVRGGYTWANAPTATTQLSFTGLSLARALSWRRRSDTGYRITGRNMNRLIIQPDNQQLAFELTQSELKPGNTAGVYQPNDKNYNAGEFTVEVWPYIDGGPLPNAWFLSEPVSDDYSIKMLSVADIQERSETNVGKEAVTEYYKSEYYFMVDHPYSVFGSAGS